MVDYKTNETEQVILTSEGQQIHDEGSHEYKVWALVNEKGQVPPKDPSLSKVGLGNAMKLGWVKKEGDVLKAVMEQVTDETQAGLKGAQQLKTLPEKQLKDFVKRKLVTTQKRIAYEVRKGNKWAREIPVEVTDLTVDMLESGSWKSANFKPYNFKALGAQQNAGTLHPLNKVREEFRKIFFNWDFIEMPTAR